MGTVPGQAVRRGALLARIEGREVQARLDQALAVRQQAQDDLRRAASLLKQNILPQSEFDGAQSRARVAEAAVQEAETLLGYTRIEAPFDGTITRKDADVGDLAAPGKPLLEMEDGRALRLEADVPEAVVGRLTLGDVLPVRVDALPTGLRGRDHRPARAGLRSHAARPDGDRLRGGGRQGTPAPGADGTALR